MAYDLRSEIGVIRMAKTMCTAAAILVCLAGGFAAKAWVSRQVLHRLESLDSLVAQPAKAEVNIDSLPKVFFWAWERPEDLRFLENKNAGVAFLAKTIYVPTRDRDPHGESGGSLIVRPRLQPLRVAPGTPLIAVVRIETRAGRQPAEHMLESARAQTTAPFTPLQQESVIDEIVAVASRSNVRAIQIDMDATASERAFYSGVLSGVRRRLPASLPLSIAALASWCIGDRWLTALPPGTIDEAVPMLFRMGADSGNVVRYLRSGDEFPVAPCRLSLGVSTDEPLTKGPPSGGFAGALSGRRGKRVYVFAPRAWTQANAEAVLKEWQP